MAQVPAVPPHRYRHNYDPNAPAPNASVHHRAIHHFSGYGVHQQRLYNAHINTEFEGRNPNGPHFREERPTGVHSGFTNQRLPANTPGLTPAQIAQELASPTNKIPDIWWRTFLPPAAYRRLDANGHQINHGAGHKVGAHLPQLEAQNLPAPTKELIVDAHGVAHDIVANARPLLLYQRKHTIDTDGADKHCAYGKIRDESTNSWRCIKNPNHHNTDM